MAIYFRTGKPGSGKTLTTIAEVIEKQKDRLKEIEKNPDKDLKPRKVYYSNNIRFDKKHPLYSEVEDWIPLSFEQIKQIHLTKEQMEKGETVLTLEWFDNGSILIVDEAHFCYTAKSTLGDKPPHIMFLTMHRHSGLDIYMLSQAEKQLHTWAREQVKYHRHLTQFGSAQKYNYEETIDGTLSQVDKSSISKSTLPVSFPKKYYGIYESSVEHTDNKTFLQLLKQLPKPVKFALVVVPFGLIFAVTTLADLMTVDTSQDIQQFENEQEQVESSKDSSSLPNPMSLLAEEDAPKIYLSTFFKSFGVTKVLFHYVSPDGTQITLTKDDLIKIGYPVQEVREGVYTIEGLVITYKKPEINEGKDDEDNNK